MGGATTGTVKIIRGGKMKYLILYSLLIIIVGCGSGDTINTYEITPNKESIIISDFYITPNPAPLAATTYLWFYVESVSNLQEMELLHIKSVIDGRIIRDYIIPIIEPLYWVDGWLVIINTVTVRTPSTREIIIWVEMSDKTLSNELTTIFVAE